VGFAASQPRIWPVAPDWSGGVGESLAWATDVAYDSATGVSSHVSYRTGPRRSFSFDLLAGTQERRVADMLLAGPSGAWLLPVWPDVQWLTASAFTGTAELPCATAGFDFVAGGKALLYAGVNAWEVVDVVSIEADRLVLADVPATAWAPGLRLYPLRAARLQDGGEERHYNDEVSRRSLAFDIDEPSSWPVLAGLTTYQGHPVLEDRPDESEDPTSAYNRLLQRVDYDGARPFAYDLPDVALRVQRTHWTLVGRERHTWFRSLLYTLCGRRVPMWLPSWNADLQVAAAVAGGSTSVSIEWAGYTLFGLGRHNRRDLRIVLADGTALHRRIVGAVEAGATETLTLDAALDAGAVDPSQIRSVSMMTLATLASDTAEIDHKTDQDGVATCTLGWQAVVPDA
jgi:hypothetical protein